MSRDRYLYLACFGFGAGVLWRSFLHVDGYTALFIGVVYILVISFSILAKKKWDIIISILLLTFVLGIVRFRMADVGPPAFFEAQVGQTMSVSGVITDEPARSDNGVKLIIKTNTEEPTTKIVIFAQQDNGYRYGDEIQVNGVLEKPTNFMTDQGLEFDYTNYLRKDGIFYTMRKPEIEILSSGHGSTIKSGLFFAKEQFEHAIKTSIPPPESILLNGVILGERSAFSQSLNQAFIDTGTIHIITIGGYHVTLIAQWIIKILSFLPKYGGIAAGIVGIFLYIITTGAAQTAIRSGIMAVLALLAEATGRTYAAGRALILAAAFMVLINPFVLAYDISFELSFIATIAIIFLSPKIEPYFHWIPWKWLREIVVITSSMYIFALPFVLYRMGSLSLVALPANVLIIPVMPIAMIAGFVTGFAGLLSPLLAFIPGKIAFMLLHYQINAIEILARLPFAALSIPHFPLILVLAIYALFIWIFVSDSRNKKETKDPHPRARLDRRLLILITPLCITLVASGFFYYQHYHLVQATEKQLHSILDTTAKIDSNGAFVPDEATKTENCTTKGPLPDHDCTPGAIFEDATVEQICVSGYTKTVRNVSTTTRKQVFQSYNIAYPPARGAYEVDHLIPLALGGANDISNLFPESAEPTPGFHEKDVVEVYLQHEVCAGRIALPAAQRQTATDWLAVYNHISTEDIRAIKKKYGGDANQ